MKTQKQKSFYIKLGAVASILFGLLYIRIWLLFVIIFCTITGTGLFNVPDLIFHILLVLPAVLFFVINYFYTKHMNKRFKSESSVSLEIMGGNTLLAVVFGFIEFAIQL